ncbi:DUF1489 family protein, partial [Rhizobium ruizarguesonis]
QGWRYYTEDDLPRDLTSLGAGIAEMPASICM